MMGCTDCLADYCNGLAKLFLLARLPLRPMRPHSRRGGTTGGGAPSALPAFRALRLRLVATLPQDEVWQLVAVDRIAEMGKGFCQRLQFVEQLAKARLGAALGEFEDLG